MKLEIDVAALFATLDPKYKWIGTNCHGALFAFENKPIRTIDGRGWCLTGIWDTIKSDPQLFARPVPSAWKLGDCDLPVGAYILWRYVDDEGNRSIPRTSTVGEMRYQPRCVRVLPIEWCEIPK